MELTVAIQTLTLQNWSYFSINIKGLEAHKSLYVPQYWKSKVLSKGKKMYLPGNVCKYQ